MQERSKALLLRLAANGALVDGEQANGVIAARDRAFRIRINTLNLQYLNGGLADSLLHRLSTTAEAYRLFQDSLKKTGDPLFASRYNLEPPTPETIRRFLLTQNETLLEYAVTDCSIFIFVVSPRSFHMYRADRSVLKETATLRNLHGLSAKAFSTASYRVYRSLIEPVKAHFTSGRLVIVPDADLYYLNFEVLISHDREQWFSDMPYLIRSYSLSYLLSAASSFQKGSVSRSHANTGALLFTPVFSDEMKAAYQNGLPSPDLADPDYLYLYRQPFALQAARQIGRLVDHDLYTEQDAEEATFKRLAAEYRILHLGTHGQINNDAPSKSRLFFAKSAADPSNTDDGYLHAYEIYGMQLQAELAVLTACETGQGLLRHGEGVISLAHSFLYAGCRSVVMSLWKIDEKSSAEIISAFYENLSKGQSKRAALRNAKIALMQQGGERIAHPYYWAGLSLIGDTAPLYPDYSWVYLIIGTIAAVALGLWLYRRRQNN